MCKRITFTRIGCFYKASCSDPNCQRLTNIANKLELLVTTENPHNPTISEDNPRIVSFPFTSFRHIVTILNKNKLSVVIG